MTKHQEAVGVILGGFVLYLIDTLLTQSSKTRGSTIRLVQTLRAVNSSTKYIPYGKLGNEAWTNTILFIGDDNTVVISDAVEFLMYEQSDIITELYGPNILSIVNNFMIKQHQEVDKDTVVKSRVVVKTMIKEIQKSVFKYFKEN